MVQLFISFIFYFFFAVKNREMHDTGHSASEVLFHDGPNYYFFLSKKRECKMQQT